MITKQQQFFARLWDFSAKYKEPLEQDRFTLCKLCLERPTGCWKNQEFKCEHDRRKAEQLSLFCPIGKWGHKPEIIIPRVYHGVCPFTPDRAVIINLAYRRDLRA